MRRAFKGEITIFLSLIFSVLLIVVLGLWESSLYYLQKSHIENNMSMAGNSLLSEYNKTLWEKYSLFVIDSSYRGKTAQTGKMTAHAQNYIEENLNGSGQSKKKITENSIEVVDIGYATDNSCEALYEQIMDVMELEDVKEELEISISDEEQRYVADRLKKSHATWEEFLEEWDFALENSLCESEEYFNPSKRIRENVEGDIDFLFRKYCPKIPVEEDIIDVTGESKEVDDANLTDIAGENCGDKLARYICQKCTCMTKPGDSCSCPYEAEYILGGESLEKATAGKFLNELMGILAERNYRYLLSNNYMYLEAEKEAEHLLEKIENENLEVYVRTSLIAAWAYTEAYLELEGLLSGERIDYFYPENTWRIPIEDLTEYGSFEVLPSREGINYEDLVYIDLKWSDKKGVLKRFSNVAERNVRLIDESGFDMDKSITSFSIMADMRLLGWKNTNIVRKYGYLE